MNDDFDDVEVVTELLESEPDNYVFMVTVGEEFNAITDAGPREVVDMMGVLMMTVHRETGVPVNKIAMDAAEIAHKNDDAPGFSQVM